MEWKALIIDGYERVPQELEEVLKGLTMGDLDIQPHPECNSIGWTVWHLARVQDSQIADLMNKEQIWIRDGWYTRFKRSADPDDTGYGHTAEQVTAFKSPSVKTQMEYLHAVLERTKGYISGISPSDLDRKLDEPWYQPVPSVGVRIVSIMADCLQHAGEASYIRGLLKAEGKL